MVVSYDIACKYHIHFIDRATHPDWPLITTQEAKKINDKEVEIIWLVPKFHLAAHIEGCADKFSFNWTKNVGRTCGELVETNWASLNLLATSTREMGFGHRRDTLIDAQNDWNWRKATREGEWHSVCRTVNGIDEVSVPSKSKAESISRDNSYSGETTADTYES